MSSFPLPDPNQPEADQQAAEEQSTSAPISPIELPTSELGSRATELPEPEFQFEQPRPILTYTPQPLPPVRFPNVVDLLLVGLLFGLGFLGAGAVTALALHFHLFGVSTLKDAITDIHYSLGSQAAWYCFTYLGCLLVFPIIWHIGFMRGMEWRARAAFHARWKLLSAAFACFVLAIIDGIVMPGPKEAPIDEVFKLPGAALLLFLFGITVAPFFEEMGFRGFLLPALCTAWDWTIEHVRHLPPREPDAEGKTRWSIPAMIAGSLITSIPFALMHSPQNGYSLGPFVLLVCVSLALCWVRLSTRSLAASTMVHAGYNLLLFATMALASGGFKNLDKM